MATIHLPPIPIRHDQPYVNYNPKTSHNNQKTDKNRNFSDHSSLSLLDKCSSTTQLKQIHAHMLRIGLFSDPYSASRLLTGYALSLTDALNDADKIFDQIPNPNLYCWNTLIRAHASGPDPLQSFLIFSQMLSQGIHSPNKFTFPFLVKAASELSALKDGTVVHGMVIKSGFHSDVFILNSLIHFYSSCLSLDLAYRVFLKIPERDVVSWNSMITAFAQGDHPEAALDLFREMEAEDIRPNDVTMVSVISACAKKGDLEFGRWIHSYFKRNKIKMDLILSNAILDMYTKCGSLEDAKKLFDKMEERDSFSWTTMLVGHARVGEFAAARSIFDAMSSKDIASWNAVISAYEQSDQPKEALALFHELQLAEVKPDRVTVVSVLSACAQLGAIDLGQWIHAYIKKQNFRLNFHLTTSLIDMYSKCGDLEKALEVFDSAGKKDVFVWSAMIAGLAMHGRGKAAIDVFVQMEEAKVKPNDVTFTNVLCACSHAGLVDMGRHYFSQMLPVYGISPKVEHYGCMVDILGRAGFLEEACELIEKMPIPPRASVWGALLGGCRIHGNLGLAEYACNRLLELEPRNHGAYVLLSNIYAKLGKWDDVTRLRKSMKDSGLKKEPGCSSIEVDGIIHEFLVGDISHPLSVKIYSKLEEIGSRMKSVGFESNRSQVLQDIEDEDVKEQALSFHSERLAIAFGLISTGPSVLIRIVKNLRVCGDCHSAAKLISRLYSREIVLRDRYRFHHFKEGNCSCKDYW